MKRLIAIALLAASPLFGYCSPARAADLYANQMPTAAGAGPSVHGVAITPNDTTPLTQPTRSLYVGGTGDVTVILSGDTAAITFKAVPVGTTLNIRAATVKSTGTTATLLLGLW